MQLHNLLLLTDIGMSYLALPSDNSTIRSVADFGAVVIVGEHDAVGASALASYDQAFSLGIELRYRRRLDWKQSIDLGIGIPIWGAYGAGSVYGLLKWNPLPWFCIALRPELRRKAGSNFQYQYIGCNQ